LLRDAGAGWCLFDFEKYRSLSDGVERRAGAVARELSSM
jgi:hypothetical protein